MGLNDKLKMAATSSVVEDILAEGAKFTTASPKTQRRWKSVAIRRLKEIAVATEAKVVSERKTEKPPHKKKA